MSAKPAISHEEATVAAMMRDPEFARTYLTVALTEGDDDEFLVALGRMLRARGEMRVAAEVAAINLQSMYRSLSARGNPSLRTVVRILESLGLRLAVIEGQPEVRAAMEAGAAAVDNSEPGAGGAGVQDGIKRFDLDDVASAAGTAGTATIATMEPVCLN